MFLRNGSLKGMDVDFQEIFGIVKNIHLEIRFLVTIADTASVIICSDAINIIKLKEMGGQSEDLKLLLQLIHHQSFI